MCLDQQESGRNSDNALIKERLGWAPSMLLEDGVKKYIIRLH